MIPLTTAQSALAAQYIPLAKRLARRFRFVFPRERPDFRSAAYLGLVEAAARYREDVGVDFATYAKHRIEGAMRTARSEIWDGLPMLLMAHADNAIAPARPVGSDLDDHDAVIDLIRRLPGKHRHLCRLLYLDGLDRREAGRIMHLSKARISRLHAEALDLLKAS